MIPQTITSAPPPKKRYSPVVPSHIRVKYTKKSLENKANTRVRAWLLRYLHDINTLADPLLSVTTLQQILNPSDPCGAHHRERILKYVPRIHKAKKRERLLKIAAKLLAQLSKEILGNLEDLGGAA